MFLFRGYRKQKGSKLVILYINPLWALKFDQLSAKKCQKSVQNLIFYGNL